MTSDRKVIDGLTTALKTTDASRRVGWAKSFEAEKKIDQAQRDANIHRADAVMLARSLAVLTGFTQTYLQRHGGNAAHAALAKLTGRYSTYLPDSALRAGREAGSRAADTDEQNLERAKLKLDKKRLNRQSERAYKAGQASERERLAKRYGFANAAALLNHLETQEDQ